MRAASNSSAKAGADRSAGEGYGDHEALLPTTTKSGNEKREATKLTIDMTAYDHFSVLAWIATDTCWSQESEWVIVPWTFTATFFSLSVWLSRKTPHDFFHALAVFFWLVGGNSLWMYQEFKRENEIMHWTCVSCFSLAIALEVGQLTFFRLVQREGEIDKRNLSNDFQAIAILSWAVHDLCEYMYFDERISDALATTLIVVWWIMSTIILVQQSYYLWVQNRVLATDPTDSGWDYALALWAWSLGCVLWGYGDIYLENQHGVALFALPDEPLNMRWYTFWVIVIGSMPLALWCIKYLWNKIMGLCTKKND